MLDHLDLRRSADGVGFLSEPPAVEAFQRLVCVDLDGTLIKTDTLWESLLLLARSRPWELFLVVVWLWRGKAHLKRQLAERVVPEAALLPYRPAVLESLYDLKDAGDRLVLATAADERVARRVADHLDLFDEVIASDGETNRAGASKLFAIQRLAGPAAFDYWGDSLADLPLWQAAEQAYLVDAKQRVCQAVRAVCSPRRIDCARRSRAGALVSALRPHQWVKNLLVLLPLFLAHEWNQWAKLALAMAALIAFSSVASAIYIVNDLLDIEADRRHPSKRRRPFAAGDLSVPAGLLAACGAGVVGMAIALGCVSLPFAGWLAVYLVATTAYSLYLKKQLLVDVMLLAGLYTLRIAAGAAAVDVPLSPWLLAFSMFFFLSLALGKRYVELARVAARTLGDGDLRSLSATCMAAGQEAVLPGRGYCADDARLLETIGPTSGYLAVLVFCLYIDSNVVGALYRNPTLLWWICPVLLYWITRFWLLARRRQVTDDPVVFALRDPASMGLIAVTAVLVLLATA
jgi:4-hydroxybenzoate polyprenyltransferase/phosphoserine phosphatase